jgi:hypothetical protein
MYNIIISEIKLYKELVSYLNCALAGPVGRNITAAMKMYSELYLSKNKAFRCILQIPRPL